MMAARMRVRTNWVRPWCSLSLQEGPLMLMIHGSVEEAVQDGGGDDGVVAEELTPAGQ